MYEQEKVIARLYRMANEHAQHYRRMALTQLAQLIDFDGALWGTGHLSSEGFHSVDILGVDDDYPAALAETRNDNPIYNVLKAHPGQAINMQFVMADDEFYSSDLYKHFFARFGVERIMGVVLPDEATGIFTLISLYRFEREKPFTKQDGATLERLAFHMVNGASHAYFLHLRQQQGIDSKEPNQQKAQAICDQHGLIFEVQPAFMALLNQYYPQHSNQGLPFNLSDLPSDGLLAEGKLNVKTDSLGDLVCITLWESSPIDRLSNREQDVVKAIVHGLTFKEAAKEIGVAPSTVSNHLYNVYRKLNISSRTELAKLLNPYSD